tara:strand:- start:2791 stop:3258 length:468 start_codon:yes stop_codon:yes gene_type:complete
MGDHAERLANMRLDCIPVFLRLPSSPESRPASSSYDLAWPAYGTGDSMRHFQTHEGWASWLECADYIREQVYERVDVRILFASKQELIAAAFKSKSALLFSGFDLATYFDREWCEKLQRLTLDAQAVAYAMSETVDHMYSTLLMDSSGHRVFVFP